MHFAFATLIVGGALSGMRNARTAFDQYGITELVRAVAVLDSSHGNLIQRDIRGKSPEQLKVTFAGLMHAGEDCIHDPKGRITPHSPARDSIAGAHAAIR
jgi:hypothetical protein